MRQQNYTRSFADVEIVQPIEGDDNEYPIRPCVVLVNGVDVGYLAKDGLQIDPGGGEKDLTVTLKLLPRRVTFSARRLPENGEASPAWTAERELLASICDRLGLLIAHLGVSKPDISGELYLDSGEFLGKVRGVATNVDHPEKEQ